jgi:hypothetical protein
MKAKCMLVLVALAMSVPTASATSDRKSQSRVQESPERPDRGHGSISGVVTDETGKRVGSATVELRDPVTEEKPAAVITNEEGSYTFGDLLPGDYEIRAKKEGKESDPVNLKVSNGPNPAPKLILRAKGK